MYKALTLVLIGIVGIACGASGLNSKSYNIERETLYPKPLPTLDLCPTCINVAEESINILLNLILDTGIIGTCVCDAVGIEEFIKLLENSDIDPIYYCEISKLCPVNDHGNANITQFSISPASGPQGTTFAIGLTYVTLNGTGTGEIVVDIHTPDKIPLGAAFLNEAKKPGTYSERITIKAEPDPSCDPTQEPCERWLPGTYNVTLQVCNGECGSKHPHSAIYDGRKGSFAVTR